jgi:hypothetical protein
VGQCGHAGDRPEQEPEPEDGLHLLFLPDHSTGPIVPRCSMVARQRDMGSMTATRRPANTNQGTRRSGAEPDSDPTTGSHPVHQPCQPSSRGAPCPPFRHSSASRSGISSPRSCPNRKLPTHSAATAPHPRPGRLRQAPPSAGVRLRLPAHRRRYLLSHHHPAAAATNGPPPGACSTWNGSRLTPTTA